MPFTICLINNYNYSKFLPDCLDSVINQTVKFDKIIIVDDGSTDNSIDVIAQYQKSNFNFFSILKKNEGQLSTFNAALPLISDNSQVFLLDSDDIYPKDYLELMKMAVGDNFPDFCYCMANEFKNGQIAENSTAFRGNYPNETFHKSSALVRSRHLWLGRQTSCISLSSSLYKKIFPYPRTGDFITRADDVIIYAASIIGSTKLFLPSIQIGYRTHESNYFFGKTSSTVESARYKAALDILFEWYCKSYSLSRHPSINEFYRELKMLTKQQRLRLEIPGNYRILRTLIGRKYIWPLLKFARLRT